MWSSFLVMASGTPESQHIKGVFFVMVFRCGCCYFFLSCFTRKRMKTFYLLVLVLVVAPSLIVGRPPPPPPGPQPGPPDQNTCTDNVPRLDLPNPSSKCESFSDGNSYQYPNDFKYKNNVTWFECPESNVRMVLSNDIPDHDVKVGNPNDPCEIPYWIVLPLNPVLAANLTEPSNLGIIAVALNGVSVFGAQEGGGTNAVEPAANAQIQDAQYWYGHAEMQHRWHYHNPQLGHETIQSQDTLLAFAMDGFPIYGPVSDEELGELDGCNGRKVNGSYRYHTRTLDQVDGNAPYCNGNSPAIQWNYVLGCWAGSLDKTEVKNAQDYDIPSDCVKVSY